jgi:methionyl-tRNA formyltransferase
MVENMRVLFIGTPDFAVPPLQSLLEHSYEICGVFTQPDRPSGRGQKLQASPVKILAQSRGIPVFQPEKIRLEENRPCIESLNPDFIVVAAYGQILPGWLLQAARIATINIHASLLPKYRGAAPVAWSIMNGDRVTGVTTMLMVEKLDAGPILLQKEIPIPLTVTTGELTNELSRAGAALLIETLAEMRKGAIIPVIQDEKLVSWAPRINKETARIPWEENALSIHNRIRAMNPWPGAYTEFRGERLIIWRSFPEDQTDDANAQGALLGVSEQGIRVKCGQGTVLNLLELQAPAKKRVTGREFINGIRLHTGELLFGNA